MTLRPPSRRLTLCAASLFFTGVSALFAQLADVPLKPGLWNTQVVVNMDPIDPDREPISTQACFSAGTTIPGYIDALTKSAPNVQCNVTNKVQTAHHITFDTTCTSPTVSSKSHHDFQIADAEHFSGSSRSTVTGTANGQPINMEMSKTFTAKFVSADCGNVKSLTGHP